MIYETIKEFIKTAKTSRSTIYRFYRKNNLLWDATKLKSNRRLIPTTHAKYFDSEILFDELQASLLQSYLYYFQLSPARKMNLLIIDEKLKVSKHRYNIK